MVQGTTPSNDDTRRIEWIFFFFAFPTYNNGRKGGRVVDKNIEALKRDTLWFYNEHRPLLKSHEWIQQKVLSSYWNQLQITEQ